MDVTLVIPSFERPGALIRTLECLGRVDYPRARWEAIVVDDGSCSATMGVVREWMAASNAPVRLVQQQHRGPAAARNAGAGVASARVLIFIDNDIIVRPDFVSRHLRALDENPGCWVIGRIVHPPELRESSFGRYRDDRWEAYQLAYAARGVSETSGMTAANLSLPAKDFESLGGFDEDFTIASCEDWDLGLRARALGIRIVYDPGIVVVHNDWAVSLERFCERQRLYSLSDVLLWQKYGSDSPRARLVCENLPVSWRDPARLVLKKVFKRILATKTGTAVIRAICGLAEWITPNASWTYRVFDLAVAIAIFRGVRDGLTRYGRHVRPGPDMRGTASLR